MKKKSILILITILVLFLTGCSKNALTEISYSEFQEKLENKESFIIDISRDGCSHCEEFSPRLEKILTDNNIEAYTIDLALLSEKEFNEFDKEFSVSGTPTTLFIKDGKETSVMDRLVGAVDNDTVINQLKEMNYIK